MVRRPGTSPTRDQPGPEVVIDGRSLRARVRALAGEVSRAYPAGVALVGVLRSSVWFLADLARAVEAPVTVDFMGISAYRGPGRARVVKDVETDLSGLPVLAVDTLMETGLTLGFVTTELARRGASSVEVCVLVDQRFRRIVPVPLAFRGWEGFGDAPAGHGLVGYGLDRDGAYRNLPYLATLGETYRAGPVQRRGASAGSACAL